MRAMNTMSRRLRAESGFTLIEMLVVILIILIISAVALPTIIPALSHRQVSEAARILQGALVGARDSAIHNNAPSGIRLLPDPTFPILRLADGTIDPSQILAANRIIPIEPAPSYREGRVNLNATALLGNFVLPYPGDGGGNYPFFSPHNHPPAGTGVLMIEESAFDPNTYLPNSPTSWFWNIRIGDKIQINNAGPWYTVVGPMTQAQANGNSEMFVNVGVPGTQSPLERAIFPNGILTKYFPEFLFLVNGQDDNNNGWTDEGWDGIDNNGNTLVDELAEWEAEQWPNQIITQLVIGVQNQPYAINRRPAPANNAREVALPTQVVIDLTTWNTTAERSRLPAQVINRYTGYVDVLVYPNGAVAPVTIYSSPASFGLSSSFLHFWLGERSDLAAPSTSVTTSPYLPVPQGLAPSRFNGQELRGEYRLVTVFTRTGQITTNENMPFDNLTAPANGSSYNPNLPFIGAQQGAR
jgi:prepilin-type N-terminal cleavage/methylation domain-containing protein